MSAATGIPIRPGSLLYCLGLHRRRCHHLGAPRARVLMSDGALRANVELTAVASRITLNQYSRSHFFVCEIRAVRTSVYAAGKSEDNPEAWADLAISRPYIDDRPGTTQ